MRTFLSRCHDNNYYSRRVKILKAITVVLGFYSWIVHRLRGGVMRTLHGLLQQPLHSMLYHCSLL